jgi:STE24 endopeptidase
MLIDLGLGLVYVLAWLVLPGSRGGNFSNLLSGFLSRFTTSPWFLVVLYGAVFGGIYALINLPLSFYEGFVLPHRFGLSNQTLKGWIGDGLKGLLVGGPIGLVVLEVIYAVLRAYPETWWLWAAGFMLLFSVVLANLAPVLLMPIFYKFTPLGEDRQDLVDRLTRLAESAGTRVRGVYQFDMSRRTKAANAALTGLGNTRRIILGDTLLTEFSDDEIETVLAHELGHHVHKDIPAGMAVGAALTLLGLYFASLVLRWGAGVFGLGGPSDISALPVFLLAIGAYGLITMPLENGFSRWRERRADEYALRATRKPQAFAAAMTRLANQNLSDADPEPWVEFLLYSHPALSKRIAAARRDLPQVIEPG